MIKIKAIDQTTGKWVYADTFAAGNESVIAITYDSNSIADLKHRRADRTNIIKLPATPRNHRIMGLAGEISETAAAAYRHLPCRLEIDGITVFGTESFFQIIEATPTHYEIKMFSGIANFFETIKEKKLRELPETGEYGIKSVNWSVRGVRKSYDENEQSIFAAMDWNTEDHDGFEAVTNGSYGDPARVDVRTLFPFVRINTLLKSICGAAGYTFETDVAGDPLYENAAVPCVSGKARPITEAQWKAKYIATRNPSEYLHFTPFDWQSATHTTVGRFVATATTLGYRLPANGTYYFHLIFEGLLFDLFRVDVKKAGNPIGSYTRPDCKVIKIEGKVGEYVEFRLIPFFLIPLTFSQITVEAVKYIADESETYPNPDFPVVLNLPDIPQLDVFKQFAQMYGQMVYVDDESKTVRCFGWDTLYKNRDKAKDWSAKLDRRWAKKEFMYDSYGQTNTIKYKETEYTDELAENEKEKTKTLKSEGNFTIPNIHLPEKKDLFEMKAAVVDTTNRVLYGGVAKIRCRKELMPVSKAPFCALYLDTLSLEWDVVRLKGDPDNSLQIPDAIIDATCVIFARFEPLQAQVLVDKYYKAFSNDVMRKCKVITEQFLLSPQDIARFDHSIPIYLDKYNMSFFVNKISNYRSDKLTEVELIALHKST